MCALVRAFSLDLAAAPRLLTTSDEIGLKESPQTCPLRPSLPCRYKTSLYTHSSTIWTLPCPSSPIVD